MRILVVCTRSPYPLIEGRALRTYNLLREAARVHSVHLCTYVQSEAEAAGIEHLRTFCSSVDPVPLYMRNRTAAMAADLAADAFRTAPVMALKYRTRAMRQTVARALERFAPDVVHLDMLHLGELLRDLRNLPVVLVEHNVETELLKRRVANEANPLRRLYLARQARKLASYEAHVCRTATAIAAVSEVDAASIRALAPRTPVTVVPNGVDTEYFAPRNDAIDPCGMVYVGGLSWFPNYDAIEFFTTRILQRVAATQADAKLTVIGQVPSAKVLEPWRNEPRVKFTGLLEDIRPTVAAAGVYVVPLRIGGGTRLKILDAMAMGKVVVATSVGCEGLRVTPNQDILVADDPETFADTVIRVMKDRDLAARIGAAGRACVERHYRWRAIAQQMESVYAHAASA